MKPQTKLTIILIVLVAGLAIILNSCKSSSRLAVSSQSIEANNVESIAQNQNQSQVAELTQTNNDLTTETEQMTTWFDSTKPVDPTTGNPPATKQEVKKTKHIDNSKINIFKNIDQKSTSNNTIKSDSKITIKEIVKSKENSKLSISFPWWLWITAAISIILLFYFSCPPFKLLVDKWVSAIKSRLKIGNR